MPTRRMPEPERGALALATWAHTTQPPVPPADVVCDHPAWTAGEVPYTTVATCTQAGRPVQVVIVD